MTIKKIVLSASLLVAGNAMAQDKTYTVKEGDTLSEIAGKFGVKTKAVLAANNLSSADRLKLGQKLRIPAATVANSTAVKDRSAASHTGYTVREGDNDVLIAKRLGVKPKELRLANMGTKWTSLHPGQVLNIPGNKKGWFATLAHRSAGAAPAGKIVAVKAAKTTSAAKKPTLVAKTYKVQNGDNDWIIAKKVGTKPSVLRSLNPDVKWASVQIGQTIRIPGQVVKSSGGTTLVASKSSEPKVKRIRSRYATITGDSVTLRRGPGTDHEIVTRVDGGTKVMVLDREGTWYKLRFPRGTEAWVRGDFLKASSAPEVASNSEGHRRRHNVVAKNDDAPLRSSSRFSRSRHESSSKPKYARSGGNGGRVADIDTDGNPVLARAKAMLGVRYRYGAASRGATDCSGLTSQAYRAAGVSIPRTAIEQSRIGKAVDKNGLKPGDLVFFKTNRGTRINHVGTYLGNGKFIHASSGRGQVMISSLNEGYYQRRYAGGRHIANFKSKKHSEPVKVAKKEEAPKVDSDPVVTPTEPPKTGDN